MRTRPAALGGIGVWPATVLALLVLGCVFVAMAGPRAGLTVRTRALRQTVGSVAPAGTAVLASTDSNNFKAASQTAGIPELASVSPDDVSTAKQEMYTQLASIGLPVGPLSTAWASMNVPFIPVGGAGPRTRAGVGLGPKLEVLYRDTLSGQSRLVAGRYPGGVPPGTHGIPVAVTQQSAARFGVHPGSRLTLPTPAGRVLTLAVSGIIQPRGLRSAFWTVDGVAAKPALIEPPSAPSYWDGAAFVGAGGLVALERAFALSAIPMQWEFPLQLDGIGAAQAPRLTRQLAGLPSLGPELTGSLRPAGQVISYSAPGVTGQLEDFLAAQDALGGVLSLVFTGLAVIGAAALLLAAQMMIRRRAMEYTVLRARGASLRQLAASTLRDAAIAVIPAAAAAVAAAVALTPGSPATLAVWLTAGTVAVALAGPPAAVMIQQRTIRRGSRAAASRRTGTLQPAGTTAAPRRLSIGRVVVEVALAAAAVGGLVLLRYEGLSSGGVNAFTSAAPVLVAVPAALCVLRLYPLVMRAVLRLSARRPGVTGFVAAAWAGRASAASILPSFALVLALTLAAFAGMVRNAVTAGEGAASWRSAGADAAITSAGDGTLTPAAVRALSRVPGAEHTAEVNVQVWTTPGGRPVTVLAVDAAQYAALVASTPWPQVAAGKLAEPAARRERQGGPSVGPVPVLASPSAARLLGTQRRVLESVQVSDGVRVAGVLSGTPAMPQGGVYVVMPSWALPAATRTQPPGLMLITGPRLDGAALTSAAHRLVSGSVVTLRATALAGLADSPLPRGTYLGYAAGLGAAAGFSVVVLLLDLALGAEERKMTLARLATMGMSAGQARRLTLMETLPAVLVAALAAVAGALVLVPLTGPVLNLSVFTGSAASVPIRPGWAALGVPIAALVGLAVATLLLHIQVERRRGVTAAMRVGQ
jgi:putative ABC transport system permease protein